MIPSHDLFLSRYPWSSVIVFVFPSFLSSELQLVEVDDHSFWVWFCQKFLLVKREFLLSTVALCMLRMGDCQSEVLVFKGKF